MEARGGSFVPRAMVQGGLKDIPRLDADTLIMAARLSGFTQVEDFSPEGDRTPTNVPWARVYRAVLLRDSFSCRLCGTSTVTRLPSRAGYNRVHLNIQVHHIVPRKDGGSDSFRNLVTLCEECHRKTFSQGYAGLPVENTLYYFEEKHMVVLPHFIDAPGAQNCRLRGLQRAFDDITGEYRVVQNLGSFIEARCVEADRRKYAEIVRDVASKYGDIDYVTLRVQIGRNRVPARVFTDPGGDYII
ncbi:HNH endonuclease [Thermogymnomonas acidicola]|nr:HNH endonuclease [Thermogymnomonas acidicola]